MLVVEDRSGARPHRALGKMVSNTAAQAGFQAVPRGTAPSSVPTLSLHQRLLIVVENSSRGPSQFPPTAHHSWMGALVLALRILLPTPHSSRGALTSLLSLYQISRPNCVQ